MQDFNGQDHGKCSFCGADKVLNPKTGKIFCSEKCWLKKKAPQSPVTVHETYLANAPQSPQTSGNPQSVANDQWVPKQHSERIVVLLERIEGDIEKIRDAVESINKKIPLRDPESGDIIPF